MLPGVWGRIAEPIAVGSLESKSTNNIPGGTPTSLFALAVSRILNKSMVTYISSLENVKCRALGARYIGVAISNNLGRAPIPLSGSTISTTSNFDIAAMRTAFLLSLAGSVASLTDIEHKPLFRKNIDPIVVPGKYVSHMHSFYGSDTITKDLPTTAQLQAGCPSGV